MRRLKERVPGVLVATAEFSATTTTVVTAGDGCLLIDPAVAIAEQERDRMVAGVQEGAPRHDLELFGRQLRCITDGTRGEIR